MNLPSIRTVVFVLGMFIFGTLNTISKKAQNMEMSWGLHGDVHVFHKPWCGELAVDFVI